MALYDTSVPDDLLTGMRLARGAIGRGELVVIPTDTVYGLAADAFAPAAVQRLLDAKGRDRTAPPPVLVPGIPTLDALAATGPDEVRELVARFWPGGLTIVLRARYAPALLASALAMWAALFFVTWDDNMRYVQWPITATVLAAALIIMQRRASASRGSSASPAPDPHR